MTLKVNNPDTHTTVKKTTSSKRPWIIAIVLFTAVALYCVFGLKLFTPEVVPMHKTYGNIGHQVTYDKNNITEEEVDYLADGLKKANFFDESRPKYVYIKKIHGSVEISISCNPSINANPSAIQSFVQLRDDMQKQFPHNKIIINIIIDTFDNVIRRLE